MGLKENPVALAALCAKRMFKAGKNESKRHEYAKELLKLMRPAGYTEDICIRLVQFIEGMSNLSTGKWVKELEGEIDSLLMEVESVEAEIVRTPILRKVLRRRTYNRVKAEGKMEMARRMFACGMELNVIADVTDFSIEELKAIVK